MRTNQKGVDLIKSFEGCKLAAYKDIVGVWTIGYGHTKDVKEGMTITQDEAEQMLKDELKKFEDGVSGLVKIPLSDNEFSALVSFAYNLGLGALGGSTLLKKLNAGNKKEAAEEFLKWNKAGGKVVSGLVRRREAERSLFLKNDDGSSSKEVLPKGPSDDDINIKFEDIEKEALDFKGDK